MAAAPPAPPVSITATCPRHNTAQMQRGGRGGALPSQPEANGRRHATAQAVNIPEARRFFFECVSGRHVVLIHNRYMGEARWI